MKNLLFLTLVGFFIIAGSTIAEADTSRRVYECKSQVKAVGRSVTKGTAKQIARVAWRSKVGASYGPLYTVWSISQKKSNSCKRKWGVYRCVVRANPCRPTGTTVITPDVLIIQSPKVGGYALDLCREQGKNCGKPAADAYCRSKGFKSAKSFFVQKDSPPTKIMNGGICRESYCDRISSVTCNKK